MVVMVMEVKGRFEGAFIGLNWIARTKSKACCAEIRDGDQFGFFMMHDASVLENFFTEMTLLAASMACIYG